MSSCLENKKILVIGGTGAMGQYMVPLLAELGATVDTVALEKFPQELARVKSIVGDASKWEFMDPLLAENHYDGIVDFMIYTTTHLPAAIAWYPQHCGHYIYLSSYRVYDSKELPIREDSPRLIDSSENELFRNSDDYSIFKARGENMLRSLPCHNWTIVRPTITYSLMRYQLVTLEGGQNVGRARRGKSVVLPEEARNVPATMTWAGDVTRMIAGLLCNGKAFGEAYSVCTAEHHTWGEIADYYKEICHLKAVWVPKEEYLNILCSWPHSFNARWSLEYDRLAPRIMDNGKILAATGLKQENFMKLFDGLKMEIDRCPPDAKWPAYQEHPAMDEYLAQRGMK